MPTMLLAVCKFPTVGGIPADTVENTFSFIDQDHVAPDIDAMTVILEELGSFYNDPVPGPGQASGIWLSPTLSRNNVATCEIYDVTNKLDGSPHGTPVLVGNLGFNVAPATAQSLPDEVAACLSFHGNINEPEHVGTTRPANRHRGRIFFGPLNTTAVTIDGTTKRPKLNTTLQADLTWHAARLVESNSPLKTHHIDWCVWSRKNNMMSPVVGGFVDDAFDTQRRRGQKATARQLFIAA